MSSDWLNGIDTVSRADTVVSFLNFKMDFDGELGTLRPYTMRDDNMITITLLACFVLFVVSMASSRHFIAKHVKDFFRSSYNSENRDYQYHASPFELFLVFLECVMMSIVAFLAASEWIDGAFAIENHILVVALMLLLMLAYVSLKWMAYALVNSVLFGSKKMRQWNAVFVLVNAWQGLLLFPLVLCLVYLAFELQNVTYFLAFVLFLNKMLTFYKSWSIFFRQKGGYLQNFLYFCALEIAPMAAFAGVWLTVVNVLKINF